MSKALRESYDDALRKLYTAEAELRRLSAEIEALRKRGKFSLNDHVTKISGAAWSGKIVGTYSTALTPEGYCVESDAHHGSVQIYPVSALAARLGESASSKCWCATCDKAANVFRSRMSLCPSCGDKRCPRSEHHDNKCVAARPGEKK